MKSWICAHIRVFSCLLAFLMGGVCAVGQELRVFVPVVDKVTMRGIWCAYSLYKVEPDSSLTFVRGGSGAEGLFALTFASRPECGEYRVEVTGAKRVQTTGRDNEFRWKTVPTEDYEPGVVDICVPAIAEGRHDMEPVVLERRRRRELKEVTATASKIMFYNKGDTLIYNADAFVLAEGSMLDAILAQMPGVELKTDGTIRVNGSRIDCMLLNGKDLFNGKGQLMLDNIAAYTVKEVAVYKKRTRLGELLDYDTGKESRVMDVRLKREYAQGGTVNAEGGYGTHNRYLAKLFGLWFSENVSVSAYASANNLSDDKRPGRSDKAWSVGDMNSGVSARHLGGLSYVASGYANRWEIKGGVDADYKVSDFVTTEATELFDSEMSMFRYEWNNAAYRDFNVRTSHDFFTKIGDVANFEVHPMFTYGSAKQVSDRLSASFREEVKDISRQMVLQAYGDGASLADSMINRLKLESELQNRRFEGSLRMKSDVRLRTGSNPNSLSFEANGRYAHRKNRYYNRYAFEYGGNMGQGAGAADGYHRFYRRYPDFDVEAKAGVTFSQLVDKHRMMLPVSYEFVFDRIRRTQDLFEVGNGDGIGVADGGLTDIFAEGSGAAVDFIGPQSYHYLQTGYGHKFSLRMQQGIGFRLLPHLDFSFTPDLSVNFLRRTMHYEQGGKPTVIVRNDILPAVWLGTVLMDFRHSWAYQLNFSYRENEVDMLSLISQPNSDPLMVVLGNDALKNSSPLRVVFMANKSYNHSRQMSYSAGVEYRFNDIETMTFVEPETGRYVLWSGNVNGVIDAQGNYKVIFPFGKGRRFNFSGNTQLRFRKRPGAVVAGFRNCQVSENLKLGWRVVGDGTVGVFADARYERYDYLDASLPGFDAWTCRYGAEATFNLPHNWSLGTDMALYTRRGYVDERLNSTDFVWNARVSKSILKGSLVFVLDGFDMLRQLSNVAYFVSAQMRTETVSNVIPSYFLFHVQYRFNKQAK